MWGAHERENGIDMVSICFFFHYFYLCLGFLILFPSISGLVILVDTRVVLCWWLGWGRWQGMGTGEEKKLTGWRDSSEIYCIKIPAIWWDTAWCQHLSVKILILLCMLNLPTGFLEKVQENLFCFDLGTVWFHVSETLGVYRSVLSLIIWIRALTF